MYIYIYIYVMYMYIYISKLVLPVWHFKGNICISKLTFDLP